jgi:Mce-associated membrane protein
VAEARSWGLVNVVLGVVLVALVAATAFFVSQGPGQDPGRVSAQRVSDEYAALTAAAGREAQAFLTVDYRHLDPTARAVLAGATGRFRTEYAKGLVHLRAAARHSRARSTGRVRVLGIGQLDARSAVVYVAADSTVSNTSTGHEPQPRYYRLRMDMKRVHGAWRTADLSFVS